jgi:hypothetical protein
MGLAAGRDTGEDRRTDLAAPTADKELVEQAPPIKPIMYLYPRERGFRFGARRVILCHRIRDKSQVSSQAE